MAKGTMPIAGCRREERVATRHVLSILGHGNVNNRVANASPTTTYPNMTHCNTVLFFPLFLPSTGTIPIPIQLNFL